VFDSAYKEGGHRQYSPHSISKQMETFDIYSDNEINPLGSNGLQNFVLGS
jgi:hypothetical protein